MLGENITQLYVFLAFFACGVLLSVPYMFCTGLLKGIASTVFDAVYCLFALWALWALNLRVNNGEFRLFLPFALVLGIIFAVRTSKRTLDNLARRLYNFATSRKVVKDNEFVLQKKDGDSDCGGNCGSGVSAVHIAGFSHATSKSQRHKRKTHNDGSSGATGRSVQTGTVGVPQDGQIRH